MSDTAFHFSDGSKAETLKELVSLLRKQDPSVTAKHITSDRNDFGLWIAHVHNDHALSAEVSKCRTPQEVASVIDKKLNPPPATSQLTPLKEKLRAIAPKPTLAVPPKREEPESKPAFTPSIPKHEQGNEHAFVSEHKRPPAEHKPPEWTPNTPLPARTSVALKNNPHVRDFVLGLVIGIIIGVLAYGLVLQVI